MKTDKCLTPADEPIFDGEKYWETMEIQATLRAWHRKHGSPLPVSGHRAETVPGRSELISPDRSARPKRQLWLFWRRHPA